MPRAGTVVAAIDRAAAELRRVDRSTSVVEVPVRCRACDLTLEWDFGNNGVSTGVLEHLHNLMLDQGVRGVRFLHVPYMYMYSLVSRTLTGLVDASRNSARGEAAAGRQ